MAALEMALPTTSTPRLAHPVDDAASSGAADPVAEHERAGDDAGGGVAAAQRAHAQDQHEASAADRQPREH